MATSKTVAEAKAAGEDLGDDLAKELKALREDLTHLAGTVKDMAVHRASAVSKKVHDAAEQVGETLKMSAEDARARGEAVAADIEAAIARRPLTSVMLALGVGYMLAALTRR